MTPSKQCDHCGRPISPRPSAPHKRFCSSGCRVSYHLEKQSRATALAGPISWPKLESIAKAAKVAAPTAVAVLEAAGLRVEPQP